MTIIRIRKRGPLVSGYSRILGLIVSDITNPFFPELVHEFEEAGTSLNYTVLVSSTSYKPERMAASVRRMLEHRAEGVAIMTSEMDSELIDKLSRSRVPLVFLDVGRIASGISNLRVDYSGGVTQAMMHLMQLGHTRIAFIAGPSSLTSASVRRTAFLDCLEAHRVATDETTVIEADHTVEGGFAAMNRLLAMPELPTAVLTSNDLTAIGSLRAIRARGLGVPHDISLIGFDDIQLAAYTEPPLTTVRLDRKERARKALDALLALGSGAARTQGRWAKKSPSGAS